MDNIDTEIEKLLEQTVPCDRGIMYDVGWGTVQIWYDKMKDRIHIRMIQKTDEELEERGELDLIKGSPGSTWSTELGIPSLPLLRLLGITEQ